MRSWEDGVMTRLEEVVLDLERHSAAQGWDSAPKLYALVESAELLAQEPQLAAELGLSEGTETIAALEQPPLPEAQARIEDALAAILWPETVAGCALVLERVVLPPEAEEQLPDDEAEAAAWAAAHPAREEVRMVVGVLRDGARYSALRLRKHDTDDEVLTGPDLIPTLADALMVTLEPDEQGQEH
jgi:hypothetical protein